MRRAAAALAMAILCVPALAAAGWRADVQHARLSGEGEFRVFGFRLYTAQLWSAQLPIAKGVRFYAGERLTAEIDDLAFAQAFFSIWLDPATRAPALRQRLLGLAQ